MDKSREETARGGLQSTHLVFQFLSSSNQGLFQFFLMSNCSKTEKINFLRFFCIVGQIDWMGDVYDVKKINRLPLQSWLQSVYYGFCDQLTYSSIISGDSQENPFSKKKKHCVCVRNNSPIKLLNLFCFRSKMDGELNITLVDDENWTLPNISREHTIRRRNITYVGFYLHETSVAAIFIVSYLLIFLVCMVGNGVVCFIVLRSKTMRTVTNLFILNLAVSDLLVGIFCMPTTLLDNIITGQCNFVY